MFWTYITSIAITVEVRKNGNPTQNHSGLNARKAIIANSDTKDITQYIPLDFLDSLMSLLLYAQN